MSTISKPTAQFLLGLLGQQQVSVGAPDFDQAIESVMRAKRELLEIIGPEEQPAPNRAARRAAARKPAAKPKR